MEMVIFESLPFIHFGQMDSKIEVMDGAKEMSASLSHVDLMTTNCFSFNYAY